MWELLVRQATIGAVVTVLVLILSSIVVIADPVDPLAALCTVGRLSLGVGTIALLWWEGRRLRAQIAIRAALVETPKPDPGSWPPWARQLARFFALIVVVSAGFAARIVWTGGALPSLFEFVFVVLVARLTLRLIRGSGTQLRLWWSTIELEEASHVRGAWPLLVAAEAIFATGLIVARLPHPWIAQAGVTLAALMLQGTFASQGHATLEFLVELGADDHISEIEPIIDEYGATYAPATPQANVYLAPQSAQTFVVSVPTVAFIPLVVSLGLDEENVSHIEFNSVVQTDPFQRGIPCGTGIGPTNDPLSAQQIAITNTGAEPILRRLTAPIRLLFRPPRQSILAVIDDGVDGSHEDLRHATPLFSSPNPNGRHGTAVAGIAAAVAGNQTGIASLNVLGKRIQLRDYPALAGTRRGADDVADAIYAAADDRADVILLAFGAEGHAPKIVRDAARYAHAKGVVLVAAAGNRGADSSASDQWPANIDGVLVATGLSGRHLASFSSRADVPLVLAAPATNVCAPVAGGGYETQNGTSMSAAIVAGAAAYFRSRCPDASRDEVIGRLISLSAQGDEYTGRHLRVDQLDQGRCP